MAYRNYMPLHRAGLRRDRWLVILEGDSESKDVSGSLYAFKVDKIVKKCCLLVVHSIVPKKKKKIERK